MNESAVSRPVRGRRTTARTDAPRVSLDRSEEDSRRAGSQESEAALAEAPDHGRNEDSHEITRKTRTERSLDTFAIPPEWKRPGWDFQYWVASVLGQPVESTSDIYEGGWRPVLWKDVTKPWPPGAKADEQVRRGGQLLYTRPMRLTEQARDEEYRAAKQQERDRIQSAQSGKVSGHEGIADIKGVRAVSLGLEVEGEVGTQSGHSRTR